MSGGKGVQLVKVSHAHGEVGVSEKLDRLGLGRIDEEHRNILLDGALFQKAGEGLGAA